MSFPPLWNKIYNTVSGYCDQIPSSYVTKVLELSKDDIVDVFIKYKPYTKEALDRWSESTKIRAELKVFVQDLSLEFNLDINITFRVVNNYLMTEYYGRLQDFKRILTDLYGKFKRILWDYYIVERRFHLKLLRIILEKFNRKYPYETVFQKFISGINIQTLQNNLVDVYVKLHEECYLRTDDDILTIRIEKNIREQIEVLHILIATTQSNRLNLEQFGRTNDVLWQRYKNMFKTSSQFNPDTLEDLAAAQIACFFVFLQNLSPEDLVTYWEAEHAKMPRLKLESMGEKIGEILILMGWLVIKIKYSGLTLTPKMEDNLDIILNCQPFAVISDMLIHPMFDDCKTGEIVTESTFQIVDNLIKVYTDIKLVFHQKKLLIIMEQFLKYDKLSNLIIEQRGSMDQILEYAINTFPYSFYAISKLFSKLLANKNCHNYIYELIKSCPIVRESPWNFPNEELIRQIEPSEFYFPETDEYKRRTARMVEILGEVMEKGGSRISLIAYLEDILTLCTRDCVYGIKCDPILLDYIWEGCNLINEMIKHCTTLELDTIDFRTVFRKLGVLFSGQQNQLPDPKLVQLYFQMQTNLIKSHKIDPYKDLIILIWKKFFIGSTVDYVNYNAAVALRRGCIQDTTLYFLLQQEIPNPTHQTLLHYLENIYHTFDLPTTPHNERYQMLGIVYILDFVFIEYHHWSYRNLHEYSRITLLCTSIFQRILQLDDEEKQRPVKSKMIEIIRFAFVQNQNTEDGFHRLFQKSYEMCVDIVTKDSNWLAGPSSYHFESIKTSIGLLMMILDFRKTDGDELFLEIICRFIRPVSFFLITMYSSTLAELACKFLCKLAMFTTVPMLMWLELDHFQVQIIFLEKLRDPAECIYVKLAVLDLINNCALHQDGMLAAFFNMKCYLAWKEDENVDEYPGESILDFMMEYLKNIQESHEYLLHPLQIGILKLFRNLWVRGRTKIFKVVIDKGEFWPLMFDVFFRKLDLTYQVYTLTLTIFIRQIVIVKSNKDDRFMVYLAKFCADEEAQTNLMTFIENASKSGKIDGYKFVKTWIELMIMTNHFAPEYFHENIKQLILRTALEALSFAIIARNGITTHLWICTYFGLFTYWPNCISIEQTVKTLTNCSKYLDLHYLNSTPEMNIHFLCIVKAILTNHKEYFENNYDILREFLKELQVMVDNTFDIFYYYLNRYDQEDPDDIQKKIKAWMIIIFIGNILLTYRQLEKIQMWFIYTKLLKKAMDCLQLFLEKEENHIYAKLVFTFLIKYSESPFVGHFLDLDLIKFAYNFKGSDDLMWSLTHAMYHKCSYEKKQWWIIYTLIMKLNLNLLTSLERHIIDYCFYFMGHHENTIFQILKLTIYTIDVSALLLICHTVKFISYLLIYKTYWNQIGGFKHNLLIEKLQLVINACIMSVISLKKINFYKLINGNVDIVPEPPKEALGVIINQLIEIIFWSLCALNRLKPKLYEYPMLSEEMLQAIPTFIKKSFNMIELKYPIVSEFDYGTLMYLVNYLTKNLLQIPVKSSEKMEKKSGGRKTRSMYKLMEIHEKKLMEHTGYVLHPPRPTDPPDSVLIHFDVSKQDVAITNSLNRSIFKDCLEMVMEFICGEIYILTDQFNDDTLLLFSNELNTELQTFYDFCNKLLHEQYNELITKGVDVPAITCVDKEMLQNYLRYYQKNDPFFILDNNYLLITMCWLKKKCNIRD